MEEMLGTSDVKEGDIIKEINATKIKSFEHLNELYDAIDVGDKVTFKFLRGDEEITIDFKKPKAMARMIIKQ